jgi:hypothetical protein
LAQLATLLYRKDLENEPPSSATTLLSPILGVNSTTIAAATSFISIPAPDISLPRSQPQPLLDSITPSFAAQNPQSKHESADKNDHKLLSTHSLSQLVLAAGTFDVGADGRYREVRRQRRRKLYLRLKGRRCRDGSNINSLDEEGNAMGKETVEEREERISFERFHEGRVAIRLLKLQASEAVEGREIEW